MSFRAALCVGLIVQAMLPSRALSVQPDEAASRFVAMKQLVGNWRIAGAPNSPLRIRFSLTAGGTVLVESWSRQDEPHSLTLYHRDAASIIATHYCPQGNQPRLSTSPMTVDGVLRFAFRDATDLDVTREAHLVALAFEPLRGGHLRSA